MSTPSIFTRIAKLHGKRAFEMVCSVRNAQKITSGFLVVTAAVISFSSNEAKAGFPGPPGFPPPPSVDVHINGFLPAPPGVNVQIDAGRPYYVEHERRVYIEREKPVKHYKKKKHHEDNGHKYGHDKQEKHGH
jgi:hypothetical protein